MDYFAGTALPDSTVATDGITPPMSATSITDGSWSLANVPVGSKLFLSVTHPNYRPTRNALVSVDAMPVTSDVYLMSTADVNRQYTSVGKAPVAGKAFFAAEMLRDNGTPLEGIPLADVTLVDAANAPVPGVLGPFFFGTVGDIDAAVTVSTLVNGKARVAFLDVPPGSYTVKINVPNNMAGITVQSTTIVTLADGATIAKTGKAGNGTGVGTGGTQPNVTDPSFKDDVYPSLQRAAAGGLGCANCHTAGGPGAVLVLDDGAPAVMARLSATLGVIDTTTPASSMFLTKPLYELPPTIQNHPNATFLDATDLHYTMFMNWITKGLKP
jgi:hypothetical protein